MHQALKACVFALVLGLPAVVPAQDLPPLGTPEASPEPFPESEPEPEPEPEAEPAEEEPVAQPTETPADAPDDTAKIGVKKTTTVKEVPPEEEEGDPRLVPAGLNLEGSVGLQHVAAAWGAQPNTYRLSLLGELYSGRNTVRFNDVDTRFIGNLLFEATPIEYFSANIRLQTRNNVNTFGRPQAMLTQGDVLVGLKGIYPMADGLYLGGDLTLDFPTDFGSAGLKLAGTSVRPRVLFSFDGSQLDAGVPFKGHLNLGYRIDNSSNLVPDGVDVTRVERFAYNLSAYNFFEVGLGFMYDLPYISPFLAWNLDVPVAGDDGVCNDPSLLCASDAGFASFPNKISLGAKAEPIEHLGLHLGIDLGLTSEDAAGLPVTAPYNIVFGASWTIDPTPKIEYVETIIEKEIDAPAAERTLYGTVVDGETGEPIPGVIVKYPGAETPQATTDSGEFRSYGFTPGSDIAVTLEHPDYETVELDETLEDTAGEQAVQIEMKATAKKATIAGRVEDEEGNPVKNLTVKITGKETYNPLPSSDGSFEQIVAAGPNTVAVSAPGYMTRGKDVNIQPDGRLDLVLVLKPEPEETLVKLRDDKIEIQQKIFFETGKENILPRSFGVLDQVASLLIENPQIQQIQIEGHTDDVGADDANMELSQARAESVRAFLIESGVSADRLIAKGFGETRPVLPNTSKRNRGFNRRVEFNIVNQ